MVIRIFSFFFQDADDDVIELEKEVEARVEAQAECDSTNDTSPDVVPDVTTIMDSDLLLSSQNYVQISRQKRKMLLVTTCKDWKKINGEVPFV